MAFPECSVVISENVPDLFARSGGIAFALQRSRQPKFRRSMKSIQTPALSETLVMASSYFCSWEFRNPAK